MAIHGGSSASPVTDLDPSALPAAATRWQTATIAKIERNTPRVTSFWFRPAAPFAFLAACLGLELDHERNRVRLKNPILPGFLDGVTLYNVKLGGSRLDIRFQRYDDDVTVSVQRRHGDVQVVVTK